MKKYIVFAALLTCLCIKSYSQIVFESGYIINESNELINCLIKNNDWKDNPDEIEYKLSEDAPIQKGSIQFIKEFGINGISKYIRATVNIDKSRKDLNFMSYERDPSFEEETLFLKVLVEGKASLFEYKNGNLTRFFYQTNDSEITQLVHKYYLVNNNIAQNNFFRQQLFNDIRCEGMSKKIYEDINYNKREIKKLFVNYNECTNSEFINYKLKEKKDLFNLTFRPGLNFSDLTINNLMTNVMDIDFDNEVSLRFGIETEFILPYNKNKWSIIIEPTYQHYSTEKTTNSSNVSGGVLNSVIKYQSFELPLGLRHYFFLNNNSKIFVDITYILDFKYNSEVKFLRGDGSTLDSLDINSNTNFGVGFGYKLKDKYSIGMRYQTSRNILSDYSFWESSFSSFSISLGYSIF